MQIAYGDWLNCTKLVHIKECDWMNRTENLVLNTEHDWIDSFEKDGGQDGTVTKQQASIILIM